MECKLDVFRFENDSDSEIIRMMKISYNLAYLVSWKNHAVNAKNNFRFDALPKTKQVFIARTITRLKTLSNNHNIHQLEIQWT